MATAASTFIIGLGAPTVVVSSLVILSVGQEGDPTASGLLAHPDTLNFAPIAYQFNPDFTTNLDNEVLLAPDARLVKTGTSSKLVRQEGLMIDVVCEETWGGQEGRRVSMPTFMFRQLYEYLRNPPPFSSTAQTYIQWSPAYRSLKTYNIELFKLVVGAGSGASVYTVNEFRGNSSNTIDSPFDGLDVEPTGFIDQSVTIHHHIVSEATA
jgi:hypothetical protein